MRRLEDRVGGGGGGVSGVPAQKFNWPAVRRLAEEVPSVPVIAPGVMSHEDIGRVRALGAKAVSFGAIHLPTKGELWTLFTNPCKPTRMVMKDMAAKNQNQRLRSSEVVSN